MRKTSYDCEDGKNETHNVILVHPMKTCEIQRCFLDCAVQTFNCGKSVAEKNTSVGFVLKRGDTTLIIM